MKSNLRSEFKQQHRVTATIPVLSNDFLFMSNLYRIEYERAQQMVEYSQCIKCASIDKKSRNHWSNVVVSLAATSRVASHAEVFLARHSIFPNVLGKGTRDETLRTTVWEAISQC